MANPAFTTKKLMQIVKTLRRPSTLFLDTFFKAKEEFTSKIVEIDIYKEKRQLAQFVHSESESHVHKRTEFERKPFTPPYIKEKLPTTASDFFEAMIGEHVYSETTPAQRAVSQMAEDMYELMNLATRRKEWFASKLLNGGAVQIVGKGLNYLLDFDMPAGNQFVLGAGDRWDDAGVNILKDFRLFRRTIGQESGKIPNVAFFGSDVVDVFLDDEKVQKLLDNRRMELGYIAPTDLPDGARYIGTIEGCKIYAYDEQYLENGVLNNYMPANMIFFGHTNAKTKRAYGAIKDKRALYATDYFFKTWEEEDPSVDWLQMQSSPLLALSESCAFGTAEVLEAA